MSHTSVATRRERKRNKKPLVSHPSGRFQMKTTEPWEYPETGSERALQDHAMRAFEELHLAGIPDDSVQYCVAVEVIHTFATVSAPDTLGISRTEAAVRFVQYELITRLSPRHKHLVEVGIGLAREALKSSYHS